MITQTERLIKWEMKKSMFPVTDVLNDFLSVYLFVQLLILEVGKTEEFYYLIVEKKSEELVVPISWDVIGMDDFSLHSK